MSGNEFDGTLIAVEGIDGSGKSTVVDGIERWAESVDETVVTSAEPTDLWTGKEVYRALGDESTPPLADFHLFVADRVKHVHERITPILSEGGVVVTDRYADSTRAYQTHRIAEQTKVSYGEAREWMETVFEPFNIEADVTIYVDIPVETALERCDEADKYEERNNLLQVKNAYDEMYSSCDPHVRIIDGTQSISAVQHIAINTVKAQLYDDDVTVEELQTYADGVQEHGE